MSDLIMRAEQGVLGVLLAGGDTAVIVEHLTSDDFGHPTHRAVYEVLRDVDLYDHDTIDDLATKVAALVDRADIDTAWLRYLAEHAPADTLVVEYTRIVMQAAFDRDVADFAQPYHDSAATTIDPQTRDAYTRVARALDAQAAVFAPTASIDSASDVTLTADLVRTVTRAETTVHLELHREDQVIADIIQHPDQATQVARWLDPDVFTTGQRRLTFELAISLGFDGDPFDTVTLAWHIQRARDIQRYHDPNGPHETPPERDYTYLTRLQTAMIVTGTAVTVGRELLTEHVQVALALSAAAAERGTAAEPALNRAEHAAPVQQARSPRSQPPMSPAPTADIRPIER